MDWIKTVSLIRRLWSKSGGPHHTCRMDGPFLLRKSSQSTILTMNMDGRPACLIRKLRIWPTSCSRSSIGAKYRTHLSCSQQWLYRLHKLRPKPIGRTRTPLGNYLFFFSLFNFRFSFGLSLAFFWCSFLPLSFLPLSPISVSPCLKMICIS